MDRQLTDRDVLAELCRSETDNEDYSFEDKSDGEGEIDLVEEDDVSPDIFSPDASEDEYIPPSDEEDEDEEFPSTSQHKKRRRIVEDDSQTGTSNTGQAGPESEGEGNQSEEEGNQGEELIEKLPEYIIIPKKKQLLGKNKYRWSTKPPKRAGRTPRRNIVLMRSRPAGAARGEINARNLFSLFLDESMIDTIVKYTNQEIAVQKENYNDQSFTKDTTDIELRALLGLVIYFGALNHNHTSAKILWHESRGLRITRTVMPLARFEFLINTLRFDERSTRDARKDIDPLAPIREVWDQFIEHCKVNYTPGPYCCIDEQLLAFRGNCGFRMYIPNKPAKYGLKLVMLCNSNGYLVNAIPYTGRKMDSGGQPKAVYFVDKLSETIRGSNRNITVDNWFSSVPLFNDMLNKYNLTMVGTLRKNKPHIPAEMLKSKPAETVMFAFDRELTMVSFAPKKNKNVILLSNMHQGHTMQKDTKLPEIIHFYNSTKGGVDLLDQMSAQYSCSRKTRRWPMCLFYGILNSACVNSFIIYKDNMYLNKQTPQSRVDFLFTLAEDLMKSWLIQRLETPTLRRGIRLAIAEQLGVQEPTLPAGDGRRAGRCCICPRSKDTKTTIKCAECKMFMCKSHIVSVCVNCRE